MGLLLQHPGVGVKVAPLAPGQVPVLARHVADEKGGDGVDAGLGAEGQELVQAVEHLRVDSPWGGHKVGRVEKRAADVHAQAAHLLEVGAHLARLPVAPHQGAGVPRPIVHPDQETRPAVFLQVADGSHLFSDRSKSPGAACEGIIARRATASKNGYT